MMEVKRMLKIVGKVIFAIIRIDLAMVRYLWKVPSESHVHLENHLRGVQMFLRSFLMRVTLRMILSQALVLISHLE